MNQGGTVTILTLLALTFILTIGGFAIDLAYLTAVKGELQRSVDAAALAGAGKLGFEGSALGVARSNAQAYGLLNGSRGEPVSLNANAENAADGDITLGVYAGGSFSPSTDGQRINAVQTRYASAVPASFLRLLGFTDLPVAATATAVASPPLTLPPNVCPFPIGISRCIFEAGAPAGSSKGCGAPIAFVARYSEPGPVPPGPRLTATWVDVPMAGAAMADRAAAAFAAVHAQETSSLGPSCNVSLQVGDPIAAATKMLDADVATNGLNFRNKFTSAYDSASVRQYRGYSGGYDGVGTWTPAAWKEDLYTGKAWRGWVPVLDLGPSCMSAAVAGARTIVGWTRLVITGVDYQGTCLGVVPPEAACSPTGRRTIYGYVECPDQVDAPYNPNPAPISALSRRLHLVR